MRHYVINIPHFLDEGFQWCMPIAVWCRNSLLFSACLIIYTSAGLTHTQRVSVGVQGSVEMGVCSSNLCFIRVDGLLLQQDPWWRMDAVVPPSMKAVRREATKNSCHMTFCFSGKHLLTVLLRTPQGE